MCAEDAYNCCSNFLTNTVCFAMKYDELASTVHAYHVILGFLKSPRVIIGAQRHVCSTRLVCLSAGF